MNINERRLNGRDVLAKTFPAKTKRGYDPIDVDAYLELVASQVDLLHGDIVRAGEQAAPVAPAPVAAAVDTEGLQSELEAAKAEVAQLQAKLEEEMAASQSMRAENQQLRTQLASVAPPPPVSTDAISIDVVEAEEVVAEPVVAEPVVAASAVVPATSQDVAVVDDRASQESYDLVLRAAQRSAEEAISAAHVRADEIIADANLTASRIAQESDRKAYEAANRAQSELAVINTEIQSQQGELAELNSVTVDRRRELRRLGETILAWANDDQGLVDLRADADVQSEPQA